MPIALVLAGLALAFASGYGLRRAAKPYPGLLFTLHKLIGLGLLALAVWMRGIIDPALGTWWAALPVIAIVLLAAAIVSGGLTSLAKPVRLASPLHHLLPYLAALALVAAVL